MGNSDQFVCEGCKRGDVKKYAKNLCQTCYKKRKKVSDGRVEDTPTKGGADRTEDNAMALQQPQQVACQPEMQSTAVPMTAPKISSVQTEAAKGWTGTCICCRRYG